MKEIITFALGLAIGLAEAGKLKEATYKMALMAANAQQYDMISLGKLSRELNSESRKAQPKKH